MKLPCVFLEIKISAETLSTYATCKGFSFIMSVHVECKVVDLVERFIANVTFVRFFPAMRQSVVLIIAFLMESFATELADEWFVPSVDSCVSVKRRGTIESLATSQTFMRFL